MDARSLLGLPDAAILEVLRHLDAHSLVMLEQTNSYFSRKEPASRLPLVEHVARETVQALCGSTAQAERFRHRSWRERLHLEEATGVGFDRAFSEDGGFRFQFSKAGTALRSVRLTGMGPKLLVSDMSTREQGTLRWQLRVKGNTAVEFGVIPADLELSHTALHKCMSAPEGPHHRAMGFCSQITAGSLLPLKAPVMRGTILDIVARRGHVEVVLLYPEDAKEISWQNGQPVQRPYRGPSQLRFEQDFPADYDVRLAVTSWAKAHFEVLHTGYTVDPEWAVDAAAIQAAEAAAGEVAAAAALPNQQEQQQLPEALMMPVDAEEADDHLLPEPHQQHQQAGQYNYDQHHQQAAPAQAEQQQQQQLVDQTAAHQATADAIAAAAMLHAQHLQQVMAGAVHAAAQDAAVAAAEADAALRHTVQQQLAAAGLHLEPLALAAAAIAAAGPDPQPMAVLHQLQALQQQHPRPLQGAQGAELAPAGGDVAIAACPIHLQVATSAPSIPGAADDSAVSSPSHCLSPTSELCRDGHLPSPSPSG